MCLFFLVGWSAGWAGRASWADWQVELTGWLS